MVSLMQMTLLNRGINILAGFLPVCRMYSQIYLVFLLILRYVINIEMQDTHIEKPKRLTPSNFHTILSMDDPWIVSFIEDYDSKKASELVQLATSVAGLVQVGFVDMDDPENDDLIEAKRISKEQIRVYEYGEDNKVQAKVVQSYKEAIQIAMESYPDELQRITDETIAAFYSRAMKEQKPRKLPVIYISNADRVIPPLRYFAIALKDIFSFATLFNPTQELLKNFSISLLPQLMVLSHLNLKTGEFEMIRYDRKIFGPYNVANILRFLVGVQNEVGDKKHRETMQRLINEGSEDAPTPRDQKGVEELTYSSTERICGSKSKALCLIAFLGNEDKMYIKNKEEILDKIRKSPTLRDHHIHYSWLNATCHRNIAEAFDVELTQLPYVIAVKRSKSLFANHIGSFSYSDLRDFLLAVLSGKRKMSKYHKFPKWQTKDCRLVKMKCANGICKDSKRPKMKRGPKLSFGGKDEL